MFEKNIFSLEVKKVRDLERVFEFKEAIRIGAYLSTPLYLIFSFCDLIYAPDIFYELLCIRLFIVPASIICILVNKKVSGYKSAQLNILFFIFMNSVLITIMSLFLLEKGASPYYAGLNLVAIASLSLIPWNSRFLYIPILTIYSPYYVGVFLLNPSSKDLNMLATHSFFIICTIFISIIVRLFNEYLRLSEVKSRLQLKDEITNRNKIIKKKTQEAIQLTKLSQQFSPQVVEAVQKGDINLKAGVRGAQLCALFIDIVNFTEKVTTIEKENVDKIVTLFMDDTCKVLLKYDITIDKFLGDGILAFSNAPLKYNDYKMRIVRAAIEIRECILQRQCLYENYWKSPIQIRIGVASGIANVGFYGSDKYYYSYTAIGPVINLASRLCGAAEPDQILISSDVADDLAKDEFEVLLVGKKDLKGFENATIEAFEIISAKTNTEIGSEILNCPECQNIMHVATNDLGIFIFKCRSCSYVDDFVQTPTKKKNSITKSHFKLL